MKHTLLFLCCLPFLLGAQSETEKIKDDRSWLQRARFSIGVSVQRDMLPRAPYGFRAADLVPHYQRKGLPSLLLGWQPFFRAPYLRAEVRAGRADLQFSGNSGNTGVNRYTPDFREEIDYQAWQLATGVRLDASQRNRVTPYLGAHFLLAVPTQLSYELFRDGSTITVLPSYVSVEGGARTSPGWEISYGLRIKAGEQWRILLGGYYTQHDIRVDWPDLESRRLREIVLQTNTLGWSVALSRSL